MILRNSINNILSITVIIIITTTLHHLTPPTLSWTIPPTPSSSRIFKRSTSSLIITNTHSLPHANDDNNNNAETYTTTATTTTTFQKQISRLATLHRNLLKPTRQRFVTGSYPLLVTVRDSPTRKWLGLSKPTSQSPTQIFVNGTLIEKSLASFDRFDWLNDVNDDIRRRRRRYDDDDDCQINDDYYSLELVGEISTRYPGYLHMIPRNKEDVLWVTDFSINPSKKGGLTMIRTTSGDMREVGKRRAFETDKRVISFGWPNEVNAVPVQRYGSGGGGRSALVAGVTDDKREVMMEEEEEEEEYEDALLVTDGFLVPGRDNGGLYVVKNPGNERTEKKVCLTGGDSDAAAGAAVGDDSSSWFYHRAIWVDLTGDGRLSILTARAKPPSLLKDDINGKKKSSSRSSSTTNSSNNKNNGQLVWLERPQPHRYDEETGTPLDKDGTVFDPFSATNTPWTVRVLDSGPDVMFSVADLDTTDDTIEVIASQFFGKCLSLHSIKISPTPTVVFSRIIDATCGASFSSLLANLDDDDRRRQGRGGGLVIDSGSTIPTLKRGDRFTHLLVTSHECTPEDEITSSSSSSSLSSPSHNKNDKHNNNNHHRRTIRMGGSTVDGGSLFAYAVPSTEWKTMEWKRTIIATGFRVKSQWWNMINPGAPGFCYTFHAKMDDDDNDDDGSSRQCRTRYRPLIGIAGDCAEAAYILRPVDGRDDDDDDETTITTPTTTKKDDDYDPATDYALMCEIECGGTVGSLAIGYDNFCNAPGQSRGYAKIYVPCFERRKILVFALGNGEDDDDDDEEEDEEDDGW